MINKDGKLFGKISIIDILVVIVILAMAAGIYMKFAATPETVKVETQKFSYTVKVEEVRKYTVDGLKEMGAAYDKETKEYLGEIVEILSVEQTKATGVNSRGTAVSTEYPDKYTVTLRIETDGNVSDAGYYTSTNKLIGVGGELTIETKYVSTTGKVANIEED